MNDNDKGRVTYEMWLDGVRYQRVADAPKTIKQIMEQRGFATIAQLAREVGMPYSSIAKIINGQRQMSMSTALTLAHALRVSVDEVLTALAA